ncbi:hypothetical protein [Ruegeria sp.]|uniref:hypothetical protein n=1 Tax=Ruegeria sp. TaxID=1879320 RepID=UPI003B5B62FE
MPWPDYAPIVADDQVLGQDVDVERTPFDDGLIRQERRFSSALLTWGVTALLDDDDALARFRAWAAREAHLWFDWTDTSSGARRRVRVRSGAGGINYTARVHGNLRRWEAVMTLEGWPVTGI